MSTEVTKAKETAVSTDVMDDIFEFAGEGASFSSDEMQIPFVRLLQAMSPQLSKKKAEYIEGASAGDAFNNVTSQYWAGETGIKVIPCFVTTKYFEFVPRDMGGGFKGEIPANSPLIHRTTRSGAKEMLPNGNELVKSVQYFCFIVDDDGSYQPVVIDFKSTQIKVAKRWNSQISMQKIKNPKTGMLSQVPIFATMWRLFSVEESNDQGSWNNWNVERVGLVEDQSLRLQAKAFRDSIMSGEVRAAAEDDGSSRGSSGQDDEIPF